MHLPILQQIANILTVNIQYYDNIDLLKGRQGVLLFLYHYSRYINSKLYSEFSDNLVDIIEHINKISSNDFAQGLSGIGWSIDYLIKNNFIEADGDVLEDIDKDIDTMSIGDFIKEMESDIPLFSKGLYFLQRGCIDSNYKTLMQCDDLLNIDSVKIPLSYANSIFYVINRIDFTQCAIKNICESILDRLFVYIKAEISNKKGTFLDYYLLNNNINNVSVPIGKHDWNSLLQKCEKPSLREIAWTNFIYKYDNMPKSNINDAEIRKIINETWNSDPEELCLYNGLAGIGLEILRSVDGIIKQ